MGRMDTGRNPSIPTYPISGLPEGLQGGRAPWKVTTRIKKRFLIFIEYLIQRKHLVTTSNVLLHLILTITP